MTTLSVCFNVLLLQVVWGFAQLKLSGTVTEIDNTQDQNKTERNVTSTDVVGSCTTEASESVLHLYLMYIAQCSSHFGVFFDCGNLKYCTDFTGCEQGNCIALVVQTVSRRWTIFRFS